MGDGGEGSFRHNEHFFMQYNNSLVWIQNVSPSEEIILDGPGSARRELARWGCISPSEEKAELLQDAPFIPASNSATS